MLRLATLATLALAATLSAQVRPCLAASDNPTFDDAVSMGGPNLLLAIRETTGNTPLTVFAVDVFTGERTGTNTLGIWSHDPTLDRPLADLGTGSFAMSTPNGFQGANLPAPVTLAPNTTFWIVWGPQNGAQSAVEGRNTSTGQPYRGSFDAGQSWNGPFVNYDWKYRLWCSPRFYAGFSVFGTACPATSRITPRIGISGLPQQGTTVALTLVYSQPAVAGLPAFLGLGFSDQLWAGGIPLPFDLTLLGAPTCSVLVDLLAMTTTNMDGGGNASFNFVVPTQPSTFGLDVYAQWIVPDPQANALGLVFSAGGKMTIGS